MKIILVLTTLLFIACGNPASNQDALYNIQTGDINLNEIAYEIADAVLYSNYFVYGESVFIKNPLAQILNSDVNQNGQYLTVADLQYLMRVIVGDALPSPNIIDQTPATVTINNNNLSVNIVAGAAHLIVEGDVTPQLHADNMDMTFNYNGTNTHILILSLSGESFSGDFLEVTGNIIHIEIATRDGGETILN